MSPSLRQRRRREAELEISMAALTLFEQQGVQATSVEQIAGEVGVSARTVFRYFAHKEDTALVAHTELRRALRAAIDETGMDVDPLEGIVRAVERVFDQFDASESPLRDALLRVDRLKYSEPSLLQAGLRVDAGQAVWLTDVLAERAGADRLHAAATAEMIGVLFRLTLQRWADRQRDASPMTMLETFREVRQEFLSIGDALRTLLP